MDFVPDLTIWRPFAQTWEMKRKDLYKMLDGMLTTANLNAVDQLLSRWNEICYAMAKVQHEPILQEVFAQSAKELEEGVDQILARLAHIFEHRRSIWYWSHEELSGMVEKNAEFTRAKYVELLGNEAAFENELGTRWRVMLSRIELLIAEHSAGWTSPKPKPWHERNWALAKVVDWIIPFALGSGVTLLGQSFWG